MSVKKDPLSFIVNNRQTPAKRVVEKRRVDFDEIYTVNDNDESSKQASRCLDCGNPYCEWKCPLHNYIPNWLEQVTEGNYQQAYELMYQTNPLPEICGRVCPQDRLCEQACTINTGFGAVTIGAIEKNISDQAMKNDWRPDLSKVPTSNKRVAIVGAGPAGLACADQLVRNGIKAVVYDRYPEIGGLLTFGIPAFKLEKIIIQKRRKYLQDLGVEFKLNTTVGKDISFEQLNAKHDSVFLAMGSYTSVTSTIPSIDSVGVIQALDYLIGNINHHEKFRMRSYVYHDLKGKNVIVLGGGDTAMDCVRTAIRQAAKSVTCVYRRDQLSMPGSQTEVTNAEEEGVNFLFNYSPTSVEIDKESKHVIGLNVEKTIQKVGNNLEIINDSQRLLSADIIITAFGFRASPAFWFEQNKIKLKSTGLIDTFQTDHDIGYEQQTSVAGIFAGGDMVRGADLVVTAIADGIKAANEIIDYLSE